MSESRPEYAGAEDAMEVPTGTEQLTAPFPLGLYFGGKRTIAAVVWQALGHPKHYLEPFFGSGAVLLARPDYDPTTDVETVCDLDGWLANVWRALQHDPDGVARWCDWPVNHCVIGGTQIATPSGHIPVEGVQRGMTVLGFDGVSIVPTVVTDTARRLTDTPLVRVHGLTLTVDHPVWTLEDGYVMAGALTSKHHLGHIRPYWGVDNADLCMVSLLYEQSSLGSVRSIRPIYRRSAVRWRNVQRKEAIPLSPLDGRAGVGKMGTQDASGVLDTLSDGGRAKPRLSYSRSRGGGWAARCRAKVDCVLSASSQTRQPDRWRRGNSRLQNATGCHREDSGHEKRKQVSTRSQKRHVWQASYPGSGGEDTLGWARPAPYSGSQRQVGIGQKRQTAYGRTPTKALRGTSGQGVIARTQDQDCSCYHQPQARSLHRDRRGIPINHGCCPCFRCSRNRCESGDSQGSSLQGQPLPFCLTVPVYNFATTTGNYFANRVLVHNCDLSARKRRLLANEARLLENLVADETWYDARLAGYWVWAASCWIGSGLTRLGQRPHISRAGDGVHALGQIPFLAKTGGGVHGMGQRPHVGEAGVGVHRISLRAENETADVRAPYTPALYAWFRRLSERLRRVRVVCGDWTRICGGDWQDNMGVVGLFFDPPYSDEARDPNVYHHDSLTVARDVEAWALTRGGRPTYRIVIAGYDGEHPGLEAAGWRVVCWKARGGYSHLGHGPANTNRYRECLWLSPHCSNDAAPGQLALWDNEDEQAIEEGEE